MNIKSGTLFLLFFCGIVCHGKAQFALQVGDKFMPIANNDEISKKALLEADTLRVLYLCPGAKDLSQMKDLLIVVQENGESALAYICPSGVFGKEVREKIEKINGGRIIIGQKKPLRETPQGVMAQSKGAMITLRIGP